MGAFLGRRRQLAQGRTLTDVHRDLLAWYQTVPPTLRYNGDSHVVDDRPMILQMQSTSLQLAYDNLQMVLFRQAVFSIDTQEVTPQRAENIRQLSQSAIRTAKISTLSVTREICRSSHASMHVGICSFTAGVVLCKLITNEANIQQKMHWHASLMDIIKLFEHFPSDSYRLAAQSLALLKAMEARAYPQGHATSPEGVHLHSQGQVGKYALDFV